MCLLDFAVADGKLIDFTLRARGETCEESRQQREARLAKEAREDRGLSATQV